MDTKRGEGSVEDVPIVTTELPESAQVKEVDSKLLGQLVSRGVLNSVAQSLIVGKCDDQLLSVQDRIDYWDSIRNEKRPGLLVRLIQKMNRSQQLSSLRGIEKRAFEPKRQG